MRLLLQSARGIVDDCTRQPNSETKEKGEKRVGWLDSAEEMMITRVVPLFALFRANPLDSPVGKPPLMALAAFSDGEMELISTSAGPLFLSPNSSKYLAMASS